MNDFSNKELGFGCMRLPLAGKETDNFDIPHCERMADAFLQSGFNYFDTAYMYHGGKSEIAVSKFLTSRHARDSFRLADKLPAWFVKTNGDTERIFNEQLSKCGVEYFDYYLLHCLNRNNYKLAKRFNHFEFLKQKKAEGKIRYGGFSFHDNAEMLDRILSEHGDVDFVQLQINYLDWEDSGIQSKLCYEVARRYNIPIIVMEPVKGGALTRLPAEAADILKAANSNRSHANWALSFVLGLEGVFMALSGMSDLSQTLDNVQTVKSLTPLSKDELSALAKVVRVLNRNKKIPCTECAYCVEHCPRNIAIPEYFYLYNNTEYDRRGEFAARYRELAAGRGKAVDCIACGKCMQICPQSIDIIDSLKLVSRAFDELK